MKRSTFRFVLAILSSHAANAQILVGPGGAGPIPFNTNAVVTEFSTTVWVGTGGSFNTPPQVNAAVQGINIATYSPAFRALPTSGTLPPSGFSGGFRYNTTARFLQSRPVSDITNGANLLLATIRNDSGVTRASLIVAYDFSLGGVPSNGSADELPGFYAYYSFTGQAGSWQPISELTGTEVVQTHFARLQLGSWPAGDLLYLLWVDDNDDGSGDPPYTIDNLWLAYSEPPPRILSQPVSTTNLVTRTVSLSVTAEGIALSYQWHKVGPGPIDPAINPSAATSTLVITNAQTSDTADYFVIVSGPFGSTPSNNGHIEIITDAPPPKLLAGRTSSLGLNFFEVHVDEALCEDVQQCGSDVTCSFNWEIVPLVGGEEGEDLVVEEVIANGTNLIFRTTLPYEFGKRYRIKVVGICDGGITDLFGNKLFPGDPGSSVDTFASLAFTATQDAEIHSNAGADTSLGQGTAVGVDNDDAGMARGLLRFEGIFGNGPNQVPPGSRIISATLRLNQVDGGSTANFHRMLIPWDEATVTWNSLVDGVTNDGVEARITADVQSPNAAANGVVTLDVTSSVSAWSDAEPNFGWAILSTGTDGWDWESSESASPPTMTVMYTDGAPCNPVITQQPPPAITFNEGSSFSISVGVSNAFGASFQWMKNGVDIPNANATSYSFSGANGGCDSGQEGSYRLRITCGGLSITSAPSVVSLIRFVTAPRLIGAWVLSETNVALEFSMTLNTASAENAAHYTFVPPVEILSVRATNRTVMLTTQPLPVSGLTLTVANVTNVVGCSGYVLAPNPTVVPLTSRRVDVPWSASWLYNTNNLDTTLSGVPWFASNYVPGADWQSGEGLFGTETSATIVSLFPTPIRTPVLPNTNTPPDQVTFYLRKQIDLPPLPPGAGYALCHFIDDGAVFYLDGVEIGRLNMVTPAVDPQISYTNRATTAGEAALQCLEFSASAGPHVLAVEVHQGGATSSSDVLFGAQVIALSTNSPKLNISKSGTSAALTWSADSSWALQRANVLTGPYVTVNPTSGFGVHTNVTAGNSTNLFFRLRYQP